MSTTPAVPAVPIEAPVQHAQAKPPVQSVPAAASVASAPSAAGAAPAAPQVPPDLRLVIEDDKAAGTYVYKIVDPRTGEVVSQVPREELLLMREASAYKPGSVISAQS